MIANVYTCCNNKNVSLIAKLLLFLLFLNMGSISAQDSLAIQYSLNARGTFKEGQLNQTILSLDGNYAVTAQYWKTEFFANYSFLKTNGRVGENELFGRVLISILPKRKLFPLVGYMYIKSEFYQIRRRHTPGLGIGWKILDNQSRTINFYAWAAYDHTDFKNILGYNTFRINTYMVGNHKLIPNKLSLQYVLYYLQSLEQSNNYIWRIEPSLLVHLSRKFSLTINLQSHFENVIAPTNTKRNSVMTVGFKFQNK